MKNIHLIPTDKPSRLLYSGNNKNLLFSKEPISFRTFERSPQNIYITNNEKIKEGDWTFDGENPYKWTSGDNEDCLYNPSSENYKGCKKIILTTDQDLIEDGIQAIDDEFLEWFVKNPSCEWVEVEKGYLGMCGFVKSSEPISKDKLHYKIIIPQEEPKTYSCCGRCNGVDDICILDREEAKQRAANYMRLKGALEVKEETLEEAAERAVNSCFKEQTLFKLGANWQAERMGLMEIELRHTKTLLASCEKALEDRDKQAERSYSEEDMNEYADYCWSFSNDNRYKSPLSPKEWFEQFKKK
jgi:hypothetical protein